MRSKAQIWLQRGLFLLGGLLLFGNSPLLRPIPGRDAGIYLYAGGLLLDGGLPYRDFWDHKPPMIYFFNAAGLFLGGGSRWGVWFLETALILAAFWLCLRLLKRAFGGFPALFATAVCLLTLPLLLEGGNLTESWALPWQFAVLWLIGGTTGGLGRRAFGIGFCAAVLLLLRQNLAGVGLAAALVVLFERRRSLPARLKDAGLMLAGAACVVLPVLGWLRMQGILEAGWDQAVRFNLVYSDVTAGLRLRAFAEGLRLTAQSGFGLLALAGWVMGLMELGKAAIPQQLRRLMTVAWIGWPLECILTSASGRWYPHYFLAWLAVGSVLIAWAVGGFLSAADADSAQALRRPRLMRWTAALVAAMAVLPMGRFGLELLRRDPLRQQLTAYIEGATQPGDWVLVWGNEPFVHVLTRRRCPTRFFEQYALYEPGYDRPAFIGEFLQDMRQRPPVLLVDASSGNTIAPPLAAAAREAWLKQRGIPLPEAMDAVFSLFSSRYEAAASLGPWTVYRLRREGTDAAA